MKILVITGGHFEEDFARTFLMGKEADRIIAADKGLAACAGLGLTPTDIVGDFDSLQNPDLLNDYRKKGVPVHSFPARKDYTDTHLALMHAASFAPDLIWLLAATGSRLDHVLANIGLLQGLADQGIRCMLADSHNEIEMMKGPQERYFEKREAYPFFSLLAYGGEAHGIDLDGFSYPLLNGSLGTDISRGISNELVSEKGRVTVKSGYLLVIRSSD